MSGSNRFSPIRIGRIIFDHRVVMAPLTRLRTNTHGDVTVEHYGQREGVSTMVYQAPLLIDVTHFRYLDI